MQEIEIIITKGLAGYGYAYIAGQRVTISEKQGIDFIDKGWARVAASAQIKGGPKINKEAKVDTVKVQVHDATDELPASMPCREILLENSLDTCAKVLVHADLSKIKGIGKKSKQSILNALK